MSIVIVEKIFWGFDRQMYDKAIYQIGQFSQNLPENDFTCITPEDFGSERTERILDTRFSLSAPTLLP